MLLMLFPLLAIVGLGFYMLREGRDDLVRAHPYARWIMVAALLPLVALIAFSLLFGIGELAADVPGGVFHLLPIIPIVILASQAWHRPVAGGVTLMVPGVVLGATFFGMMQGEIGFKVQGAIIMGVPFLLAGAGFLAAGAVARPAPLVPQH
ncbi:MAG TPA: hypothetical protein VFZ66_13750 [Herpetosiphonaceae bacterium]